jgi:hypothetical protein
VPLPGAPQAGTLVLTCHDTTLSANLTDALRSAGLQVQQLVNLSRTELLDAYRRARVFVDGMIPGVERSALEASLFGVVPVLTAAGRGALPEELPTLPHLRVDFKSDDAVYGAVLSAASAVPTLWSATENPAAREARRLQRAWASGLRLYFTSLAVAFVIRTHAGWEADAVATGASALAHYPLAIVHVVAASGAFSEQSTRDMAARVLGPSLRLSFDASDSPTAEDALPSTLHDAWKGVCVLLPPSVAVASACFVSDLVDALGSVSSGDTTVGGTLAPCPRSDSSQQRPAFQPPRVLAKVLPVGERQAGGELRFLRLPCDTGRGALVVRRRRVPSGFEHVLFTSSGESAPVPLPPLAHEDYCKPSPVPFAEYDAHGSDGAPNEQGGGGEACSASAPPSVAFLSRNLKEGSTRLRGHAIADALRGLGGSTAVLEVQSVAAGAIALPADTQVCVFIKAAIYEGAIKRCNEIGAALVLDVLDAAHLPAAKHLAQFHALIANSAHHATILGRRAIAIPHHHANVERLRSARNSSTLCLSMIDTPEKNLPLALLEAFSETASRFDMKLVVHFVRGAVLVTSAPLSLTLVQRTLLEPITRCDAAIVWPHTWRGLNAPNHNDVYTGTTTRLVTFWSLGVPAIYYTTAAYSAAAEEVGAAMGINSSLRLLSASSIADINEHLSWLLNASNSNEVDAHVSQFILGAEQFTLDALLPRYIDMLCVARRRKRYEDPISGTLE